MVNAGHESVVPQQPEDLTPVQQHTARLHQAYWAHLAEYTEHCRQSEAQHMDVLRQAATEAALRRQKPPEQTEAA